MHGSSYLALPTVLHWLTGNIGFHHIHHLSPRVQKLADTLTAGIGNLVDANLAQQSARLQSLQVKQKLGVQALAIANWAPQTILSLFR